MQEMDSIVKVGSVADFDRIWGVDSRHPLVNVIEGERIATPVGHCRKHFDLYVIYIKDARCADRLKLSPNYFGDLIRKETGKSPKEYIQTKSIVVAKEMLWQSRLSISEIGYKLGYQYPQYFTRAFKNATGMTPNEYRASSC